MQTICAYFVLLEQADLNRLDKVIKQNTFSFI